jgi:glucan phosphoethanolaminetransferase (alkaline phosphatase superfamily)
MYPDVFFFTAVALVISCLYMLKPSVFTARCVLVIVTLISLWSVLNLVCLIRIGVQLQAGILMVLVRGFRNLWPLIKGYFAASLGQVILLGTMLFGICAYSLRCFLHPARVVEVRLHHARRAVAMGLIIAVLLLIKPMVRSNTDSNFVTETLGFSSHWYALVSTITNFHKDHGPVVQTQHIWRAGQRQVLAPNSSSESLPNVILVLLESVSYSATSLGDPNLGTTPQLARLARQGVEFRLTRIPVPYTTKAFWVTLTATSPILQSNHVEAVPVDQLYEGLPSLLRKAGYRSAFFEMSEGSFECGPGFFHNLAFDWAWFRENLEDTSAYLSCIGGDDCRMIKPAFEWASKGSQPFFLMMITSVSHDLYQVPAWFEKPKEKPYDRYLQTVRYTDYFLEQLCKALQENGLEKNTMICVMGDHGTSFRVNASKGRWFPYEEVIRVPWVIYWPGHIKAGKVIDQPCSQLDITPTILGLLGFDIASADFEGKDAFVPAGSNRRFYFSCLHANSPIGFVEGNRKVVYWPYLDKVFEYDLNADPGENSPRIVSQAQTEQIKRDILEWQKRSQITVGAKQHTKRFLFSHWQTFTAGRSAWAYYVP